MKHRLGVLDRKGCGIVAAFVGAMAAPTVVLSQEAGKLEEIVVTGSFICGSPLIGGLEENVIWDPAGATGHNADGLPAGGPFCRGTLSLQRTIIPENDRFTGMPVATTELAGDSSLTWEINYARVQTLSSFGTGVPLRELPSLGAVLPATNPGVIDANQRKPSFPVQNYRRIFTRQASPLEGLLPSFAEQNTFRTSATL